MGKQKVDSIRTSVSAEQIETAIQNVQSLGQYTYMYAQAVVHRAKPGTFGLIAKAQSMEEVRKILRG